MDVREVRIGNVVYIKYQDGKHEVESIVKNNGYTGGYRIEFTDGYKCGIDSVIAITNN